MVACAVLCHLFSTRVTSWLTEKLWFKFIVCLHLHLHGNRTIKFIRIYSEEVKHKKNNFNSESGSRWDCSWVSERVGRLVRILSGLGRSRMKIISCTLPIQSLDGAFVYFCHVIFLEYLTSFSPKQCRRMIYFHAPVTWSSPATSIYVSNNVCDSSHRMTHRIGLCIVVQMALEVTLGKQYQPFSCCQMLSL